MIHICFHEIFYGLQVLTVLVLCLMNSFLLGFFFFLGEYNLVFCDVLSFLACFKSSLILYFFSQGFWILWWLKDQMVYC